MDGVIRKSWRTIIAAGALGAVMGGSGLYVGYGIDPPPRDLSKIPGLPPLPSGFPTVLPTDLNNLPTGFPGLPTDFPGLPGGLPTDFPGLPGGLPTGLPTDLPGLPTNLPTGFPGLPPGNQAGAGR